MEAVLRHPIAAGQLRFGRIRAPAAFSHLPSSTPSPSQRAGCYYYFCNSSGRARSGVCSPMPCVVCRST
ncbi:hypothetical protein VTO73DRAFT_5747 [Trametes versicolor]